MPLAALRALRDAGAQGSLSGRTSLGVALLRAGGKSLPRPSGGTLGCVIPPYNPGRDRDLLGVPPVSKGPRIGYLSYLQGALSKSEVLPLVFVSHLD